MIAGKRPLLIVGVIAAVVAPGLAMAGPQAAPGKARHILFGGSTLARTAPDSAPAKLEITGPEPRPVANAKGVQGEGPFLFAVDLDPGNYRVSIDLGGPQASETTVKAELRRLMVNRVKVPAGGTRTITFTVNVRTPEIAGGGEVRLKAPRETIDESVAWDRRLTLEFNGTRPAVHAIRIDPVTAPTIYLLGDSTVTDQSGEPYASWGQMLTAMVGSDVAVANHGQSGESVSSANSRRRFDKILSEIRPGDVFIAQFGHNDMKEMASDPDAPEKYRAGLIAWAKAIQAKGAIAVIATPMHRNRFRDGKVINSLESYPDMARAAARESGALLIDLNARSATLYEAFGPEGARDLFKHNADGTGRDPTHHSPFGAYELARIVAAELAALSPTTARYIAADFRRFDPARPDALAQFHVPASPTKPAPRPLGDDAYPNPEEATRPAASTR